MGGFVISVLLLCINVWASVRVASRVSERVHQIAYFLLIWLLPFFGALAALFLTSISAVRPRKPRANERMFEAIVDARRDAKP